MIKKFIEKHPTLWEIFKFLLVGGGATVVDFVVMSVTLYLFAPKYYNGFFSVFFGSGYEPQTVATVVGTALGFIFGLVFNYILSLVFVFSGSDTSKAKTGGGFLAFAGLSAVGLVIHILGMYVGYDLLGINEWIVKIVLTLVVLVFNYLTRKLLLFKNKKQ
ncbi:MAG: GtrA family protein [Clostridia bacterium]|nr:GtrA family protein [Clostridia bacterium]MBR2968976.1 GtrA family protein [Clostridia bacterium]